MAMITTCIDGLMGETDEALLEKREGAMEDDREATTWVEYRLIGQEEIVHRSVHVTLKQPVSSDLTVGGF